MIFGRIRRKKTIFIDPDEERFNEMMALIKDLPKKDYNDLKDAMDKGYEAYQIVRKVKTEEEKAIEKVLKQDKDIEIAETILEKETKK